MAIQKWKKLDRKKLFKHPRMELVEDRVKLPNGSETDYLVALANHHSVAVLALNESGEMLIQREYSYPPDVVMWQFPGGEIEEGEEIAQAAKRELSEESGYTARHCEVIGLYYVNNRRSASKQYVVLCTDLLPEDKAEDPEEFIESQWITHSQLDELLAKGELQNINLLATLKLWDFYKQEAKSRNR